jgi:hypothetical protein
MEWTIQISSPLFSIISLAAILVGNQDHQTQFWKGAIQGPFHQSLVAIGPVVSVCNWEVLITSVDEHYILASIKHYGWLKLFSLLAHLAFMPCFWLILKQQWTIKISSPLFSIRVRNCSDQQFLNLITKSLNEAKSIHLTQIHDRSLSWFNTSTTINN